MNIEFEEKFGTHVSLIPLTETGSIRKGNANQIDWLEVCPNDGQTEIFLIGNPPYKGAKKQSPQMKSDFARVFSGIKHSKNLDYVALWFFNGARYIRHSKAQLSFVATSSVVQGEHVGLMFGPILESGLEIGYAHTPFKWDNNAKNPAGVVVVVVNLRNPSKKGKFLFADDRQIEVSQINGYLSDAPDVFLSRRAQPISRQLPPMVFGSMPRDGGGLILTEEEYQKLLNEEPSAGRFIKKYAGTSEMLGDESRYCLWIEDQELKEAQRSSFIANRLQSVHAFRAESDASSTASFAERPHRFVQISYRPGSALAIPKVSTERRSYLPIAFLDSDTVISDLAFAIYDPEEWVFSILVSAMHMVWTRAVAGSLGTGIRYSNTIVWNNFPLPNLSNADRDSLKDLAFRVLDVREYYSESSLGELYDPDKMPSNLRLAHKELDKFVDSLYQARNFLDNTERLSLLFRMHSSLIGSEVLI